MGSPNPVSNQTNRESSHQNGVLFFILRENTNSYKQAKELSVLGNMLACLSFSLKRIRCLPFEVLFLLSRILSRATLERTLINGRCCSMDVRYSVSLKCSILKVLH